MLFFFFNDTATTEIYTLSLHDALPISGHSRWRARRFPPPARPRRPRRDRKSTRLNSSHHRISYAVFCLKKKNTSMNSSHHAIALAVLISKRHSRTLLLLSSNLARSLLSS